MQLQRYHDQTGFRTALVIKEGHKWMNVLVINEGQLQIIRRLLSEQRYMSPIQTNERKAKASLRRLARKRGTPRQIRSAVALLVQS